ncbi:TldD/PmbA family protein [Tianweitania sediminis]|uniref:TldD/PmbA family protein n=1 Tax=Tianweitania sediminis TaxID=1502156 RepID=A0A8J7R137_9HYPH|nr:TldD/PmbA family protein [Tianweitania sediminis]MBP0438628.1 TldD/PmbA family protein [Tianweitania sediminis]
MSVQTNADKLVDQVGALVEAAKRAGADAADAVAVRGRSVGVTVRLGKVENTEASESDDIALRVFVGQRVANISANAGADVEALAQRAVAMARVSPEDPFQSLADPSLLANGVDDLDLFDPTELSGEQLRQDALATEEAALSVAGVTNSSGASAGFGYGGLVLATSHGFVGQYVGSRFSRSVSVIAGEGTGMERDYDFSSRIHFAELEDPAEIGRRAGERTVRRLKSRKAKTGSVDVVFDPRVSRGIAGHLAGAINGASVARKTSFLRDMMGKPVAGSAITVTDDPARRRGPASRPFDGEGVRGKPLTMVEGGVLQHWFLSTSAARELGLQTNGRGVRAGTSVSPSSTNLVLEPGSRSPEELIGGLKTGFYVTEVFGQGVNMVTGEYSRGASGFWIDNGQLAYPVAEVTIASNLKDMFLRMIPASDVDRNFSVAAPTLLIENMTLAGS